MTYLACDGNLGRNIVRFVVLPADQALGIMNGALIQSNAQQRLVFSYRCVFSRLATMNANVLMFLIGRARELLNMDSGRGLSPTLICSATPSFLSSLTFVKDQGMRR